MIYTSLCALYKILAISTITNTFILKNTSVYLNTFPDIYWFQDDPFHFFSIRSNQITVSKIRGNYIPYLMFKLLHCFLAFYPCPLKNIYLNTHSAYVPEICWWNSKMKETVKSVCCMFVSWWWFNPTLLKRPPTRNRTKWTISLPPFTSPTACQGPAWTWKKTTVR